MKIKPMLGDWEIPRIAAIRTAEQRAFAEFAVPGRTGSVFQDLSVTPTGIVIEGSLYGDETRDAFLEKLRGAFRKGAAVTFVADILTATDVQYVVVTGLSIQESGARPDQADFRFVLRESPPPPPPPDPFGGIDTGLLDQAGSLVDSVTGALDTLDALGNLPDLGDPTKPLTGLLDSVKTATSDLDGVVAGLNALFA